MKIQSFKYIQPKKRVTKAMPAVVATIAKAVFITPPAFMASVGAYEGLKKIKTLINRGE